MGDNVRLSEIFNLLHDGSILDIKRSALDVTMLIEIKYLAEMLDPKYSYFKLILVRCRSILFELWGDSSVKAYDLLRIKALVSEMEISKAVNCDDSVSVQFIGDESLIGGSLLFSCEDILVFDEEDHLIEYEQLKHLSKYYWENIK